MTRIDGKWVLIPVSNSSNVLAIGYAPDSERSRDQGRAFVQFSTGKIYEYSPVRRTEWGLLAMSPSKGTAVHAVLRRNPRVSTELVSDERIETL